MLTDYNHNRFYKNLDDNLVYNNYASVDFEEFFALFIPKKYPKQAL
jgi:hypothetical protein